ncbi:Ig-like domain-containing protein [Curtobacterium sp. MCLR17_054]|uniref:Ig-like domain-containing protein n=1 Tax=Curtobacterium sp. MCLR17_054 TaxID=2175632 RepID=UPI0015E8C044|nr:Ig-like domain-containing protein [Curtobacterium sp. MCLR17_054]WIE68838.1 Ig-like domain-containing protein [Curtobacterium sp. MCLR17_054]
MSHKKRASTALKSMGAAGLAAATIVSGLSFGAPAATAASTTKVSTQSAMIGKFVFKGNVNYWGITGDRYTSPYVGESYASAAARASTYSFPAIGQPGAIKIEGSDRCLTASDYPALAACNGSSAQNWTITSAGKVVAPDGRELGLVGNTGGSFALHRNGSVYTLTTSTMTTTRELTAQVTKVNNIAKTAEVSGTATPNGTVTIGSKVANVNSSGNWSMTVEGLSVGANSLVATQRFNNAQVDQKTVTATIVEGGTLVGVDQGPVELERGETTQVPFVVENREARTGTKGTVVLTAPDGATFSEQDTVQGSWRRVGNTAWNASTSIPLTDGRLSNDNTTLTFDADWSSERPADQQYRFMIDVAAAEDAPEGSSSMDFDFTGTSSTNDFRAQGKTTTTVTDAEVPAPDALVVTTPADDSTVDSKRPVFSGTGDEGATIEIRDADDNLIATTVVEDGAWSVPAAADLADGSYEFDVTQTPLAGAPSTEKVSFTVATNPLTTELTAVGAFDDDVTKPATISGDATTGATVIVKDSLGNEVGRTEAVDGKYSIPVPPSFAHTGVNDFAVTQTKNDTTSPAKDVSLDYGMPAPIRITSPENGSTVQKNGLTFTGTGDNGARIDVRGSVRAIATGTVADGTWNAPVTIDLSNNVYNLRAVQTTKGGLTTQAPITITITDEAPVAPVAPLTATAAFNTTDENLPATMTGSANPGATVTVKDSNGDTIGTAVASNGRYTITIPANKAHFGVNDFTVTQTVRGQVSAPLDRSLDYGNPAAPVIQTPANGDTVTNGSIRFTGTGATGAKLDMRGNTSSIGDTKITDGAWTVDVSRQLNPAVYALHALQTSKGGLTQRVNITVTVRNEAPVAPLTATAAFNTTDENLPATMTGSANPGATVTVKDSNGDTIGTAVATNGRYTITIPANKAHFGVNDFTVTQTVRGQVSAPLDRSLDYGNPAAPVIQTPANGDTVTNGSIRFTGTGATGAKLDMRGNTSSIGDTKITDGAWTVDVSRQLNPAVYALHALQTSKGGLTQRVNITVTVRNEQITALTANGVFVQDVEQNAVVSGNAQTGADVIVREGTTVIESVKAVDGQYSVTIPATVAGVRTFTVTQTVNGTVSAPKTATLDYGTPADLVIETPGNGGTLRGDQVVFTGTGAPGAKVVLNGTVSRLGSATVNGQGAWTISVERTLTPQAYTLFTKQITKGNLNGPADQRTINVIR